MNTDSLAYVEAVRQFLHADGWETALTEQRDGTVLITATQQPTEGDRSVVVLVVTAPESHVRPEQLAELRASAAQYDADGAVVTVERGIREEVQQAAAAYDRIRALDPSAVYNSDADLVPPTPTPNYLTRRRLLAGGILAGGGLFSAGYRLWTGRSSEPEPAEPKPASIPYDELRINTDQYVGSNVFYYPTRIAEVVESTAETQLFRIQVTYTDSGWKHDVLGRWDGETYGQNYFIQFTGRVAGTRSYTPESGGERTLPEIVLTESKEI